MKRLAFWVRYWLWRALAACRRFVRYHLDTMQHPEKEDFMQADTGFRPEEQREGLRRRKERERIERAIRESKRG